MADSNLGSAPRGAGLSLYANLLDPQKSNATLSRGPIVFKAAGSDAADEASAKKPQIDSAALRFQPTKRPQLAQKPKPKASFPKAAPQEMPPQASIPAAAPQTQRPPPKSTLADWTATGDDDDVNGFYGGEKRQRGGRKRRKNKHREEQAVAQDWDDIYDPTRPNSYEEYKHSEEKIREIREWKDRLYAHRMARKSESEKDSDEEEYRPQLRSEQVKFYLSTQVLMILDQFAPPSNYSFAPPPMDSPPPKPAAKTPELDSYSPAPSTNQPPPPPPPETLPIGAISRAPVRYNLPPAPTELPTSEAELEKALAAEPEEDQTEDAEEAPRSLRPGQKGFAERLMSKYGWSKGTGLGADGSGIVNPLSVKVEKRKKKSDAEGGGFRDPPGGRGKIIGGRKNVPEAEATGKFGPMSEVIVLRGMVDGMDLDEEVEGSGDGGLMQEIGDECGEKYGRVERVYIDRHGELPKVFVKFTSQLSALRAVNALEGRIFNGNTISALFYETEPFEQGKYNE
ncbi:DNA-damage-repair/toleration-like protein [Lachnellula hyalina]|uniref:DNA-damage-repair/toleration-like protein n=1 Tax=Lachnellula hyalina TaxID=1316788 RepID=A0A8H8U4S4_9HELO|nr:DNA-damage-repair/toleration-like protein [Lachnellula hyalina]TVY30523.1 DNA-damage-repair/toleration-like protein [Lachnellula hyalina]